MLKNTDEKYGFLTKLLHWLIALGVIAQFALIYIREATPKEAPIHTQLILLHKSIGMTLLFLIVIFLLWHFVNPKPRLPENINPFEKFLGYLVQGLMFVTVFAMCSTGYLLSSAANHLPSWFGLYQFPAIAPSSESFTKLYAGCHETVSYILIALFVAHFAGGLKHHFIYKNSVLKRMLPWG